MKRSTFIAVIASAGIGLTTISAMADNRGPDFSTLDTDGNGQITMLEMQATAQARFQNVDTDGDGFLTQAELEANAQDRVKDRVARMIEHMDENGDGKLAPDEMKGKRRDPARMFERIDADKSGGISKAEFDEARANMKEHRGHGKRPRN
jgi:Ca2+-binding EF-hand superfamily protein